MGFGLNKRFVNKACVKPVVTSTSKSTEQLAASHTNIVFSVFVCGFFKVCVDVFGLSPFTQLSLSSIPTLALLIGFVVFHTILTFLLGVSLPPFVSSLSSCFLHYLLITLHKARITQATPFHLLAPSFRLLLTFRITPLFSAPPAFFC